MQVPLSSPGIIEKDIKALVEVMKTRFLSIVPKVVRKMGVISRFHKHLNNLFDINVK